MLIQWNSTITFLQSKHTFLFFNNYIEHHSIYWFVCRPNKWNSGMGGGAIFKWSWKSCTCGSWLRLRQCNFNSTTTSLQSKHTFSSLFNNYIGRHFIYWFVCHLSKWNSGIGGVTIFKWSFESCTFGSWFDVSTMRLEQSHYSVVNSFVFCSSLIRPIYLYSILLYSILLYSILLYSVLLYSVLLYSILLYSLLLYSILLYSILLYYILLYSILLYLILLYSILLYSILLYSILLYLILLYLILLYFILL